MPVLGLASIAAIRDFPDGTGARYLGFERYWGGCVSLNIEEMQWIVDQCSSATSSPRLRSSPRMGCGAQQLQPRLGVEVTAAPAGFAFAGRPQRKRPGSACHRHFLR